jgi:hypothetical protein
MEPPCIIIHKLFMPLEQSYYFVFSSSSGKISLADLMSMLHNLFFSALKLG